MKKNSYLGHYYHVPKRFVLAATVALSGALFVFGPFVAGSYAGSGTWILDPLNDDWNTPANWSSNTVPGPLDTATFHVSNITDISVSTASSAFQLVFQAGANAYQISAIPGSSLVVLEGGISNDSGVTQSFVAKADPSSNGALIQMEHGALRGPLQFIAEPPGAADLDLLSSGFSTGQTRVLPPSLTREESSPGPAAVKRIFMAGKEAQLPLRIRLELSAGPLAAPLFCGLALAPVVLLSPAKEPRSRAQ